MVSFGKVLLRDEKKTNELGALLYECSQLGDVITLSGSMGIGKTTLARSFIKKGSNVKKVSSPTYNLVQTYQSLKGDIVHFDAWRLRYPEEVIELGILDSIATSITIIEWPENIEPYVPQKNLNIKILFENNHRIAYFRGDNAWERLLKNFN